MVEFNGNSLFQKALKDAFEVFINKESASKFSNAELISTFCDRLLKGGMYVHLLRCTCWHVWVCMYVRMYACVHVRMHVRMYVGMHMHVRMYVRLHVCTYVCMYACMHACIYVSLHVCMYACL